jgi:hypothetical protein
VNVGVNEQEMSRLSFLHETRDGEIASPVDQGLVLGRIEHHLDATGRAQTLETQEGLGIGRQTDAAITRGAYEQNRAHYKLSAECF